MAKTTLTITSKNYSSWSLRGWLLAKFSGLEFEEIVTAPDDASARAEILLLSSSILVPCLRHDGATVWDTLAIGEYLNEIMPGCRPVAGGSRPARALPLDLRRNPFRLHHAARLAAGQSEGRISRASRSGRARRPISTASAPSGANASPSPAGRSCSASATMADAMYAPVVTRFMTYDVKLEAEACGLRQDHHGDAGDAGMDRRRPGRACRHRGARGRILGSAALRLARLQGSGCEQARLLKAGCHSLRQAQVRAHRRCEAGFVLAAKWFDALPLSQRNARGAIFA